MDNQRDSIIDVDDVERALSEIELKYSPENTKKIGDHKGDDIEAVLSVLSKEFDSLGLAALNLNQPMASILQQVATNSRTLVQIHRRAVGEIKDKNIENRKKESKKNELYCRLDESKALLEKTQDKYCLLQNKVQKLTHEISELKNKELYFKEELDKTKRYYANKQNELQHNLRKIKRDNEHLKEMCKQDITTPNSTNDVALKLLKKYRTNEEILKTTIQKLQTNNQELLQEILNLKEDLILLPLKFCGKREVKRKAMNLAQTLPQINENLDKMDILKN